MTNAFTVSPGWYFERGTFTSRICPWRTCGVTFAQPVIFFTSTRSNGFSAAEVSDMPMPWNSSAADVFTARVLDADLAAVLELQVDRVIDRVDTAAGRCVPLRADMNATPQISGVNFGCSAAWK